MRIALIGPTYPHRGGIAHHTTLLYRELGIKHVVTLFSFHRQYPKLFFPGKTQYDNSLETWIAPNTPCLDSLNPISWFDTYKKIRQSHPDLIIFAWWHPFFAPSFATISWLNKLIAQTPCCFLCHNARPHDSNIFNKLLTRIAFSSVDAFITQSKSDFDDIQKKWPEAICRQTVHPLYDEFLHYEMSRDEAREKLNLRDKKVILFFGLVRAYKGLETLLESMLELPQSENYHVLIAGEFYEPKKRYQPALDQLAAQNRLTLVDHYIPNEDVSLYFRAADLLAAPYHSATQSGVAQIAYAFNLPIIASNTGGLPDVVIDGKTGYLVPPQNPKALTDAIKRYFSHPDKESFAKNIQQELPKYSWGHLVHLIDEIFIDVLRKRVRKHENGR